MRCEEYLTLLSSAPVDEMQRMLEAEHAMECRECQRVASIIVEREQRLVSAYRQLDSALPALLVADAALAASRRRRVASRYRFAIGVALVVAFVMTGYRLLAPRISSVARERTLTTETFTLRCLNSTQAGALIQPYVRADGSAYYATAQRVLTVRATDEELMKTRAMLDRFDRPTAGVCTLTSPSPTVSP